MKRKADKNITLTLSEMQIIVTVIGGTLLHEHTLYAVTEDREVYKTKEFDLKRLTTIDGIYIGKLKTTEFGNVPSKGIEIPDAIKVKAYERDADTNKFKLKYKGYLCIGNKPEIVRNIMSLDFNFSE